MEIFKELPEVFRKVVEENFWDLFDNAKQIPLKDRMEDYKNSTEIYLDKTKPIILFLDGKNFSKRIKKRFLLPFDIKFTNIMDEVLIYLVDNIEGARFGYTQSDEISILITAKHKDQDLWYKGRVSKLVSISASMASVKFYSLLKNVLGINFLNVFDCKAFNVENPQEAFNWFRYRQKVAIDNSKLQFSKTYISPKELLNKSIDDKVKLITEKVNLNWDNESPRFKFGKYYTLDFKYDTPFHSDVFENFINFLNTSNMFYDVNYKKTL